MRRGFFCLLLNAAGQTNIAAAYRDVGTMDRRDGYLSAYGSLSHWERAGVRERSLAHVFDETFGVNSAFNAEVFVAPPPAVAMEFDLFGERRSSHWVKGGGVGKRGTSGWIARLRIAQSQA